MATLVQGIKTRINSVNDYYTDPYYGPGQSTSYSAELFVTLLSQNIANNTSTISIQWEMVKKNNNIGSVYNLNGSSRQRLNVNNSGSEMSVDFDLRNRTREQIGNAKTSTVTHNADGSLTILVGGYHNPGISGWPTKTIANISVTLPTIARASTFTIGDYHIYFGESLVLTINRASSSFTHKVRYIFGDEQSEFTNVGTSHSFTPPNSWAQETPNSDRMAGTVIVYTYNGNTEIGSRSASFTMYVTKSMGPSFTSVTLTPSPELFSNKYVQGLSAVKCIVNGAVGQYGATIKSYMIALSTGHYGTSNNWTSPILYSSGSVTITVTVTDSRNITYSKSYYISVDAYSSPKLDSSSYVHRVNTSGEEDQNGNRIAVKLSPQISSIGGTNSVKTLRYRYKPVGGSYSSYISVTSGQISYFDANVDSSYTIEVQLQDQVSAIIPFSYQVSSTLSIINVRADGLGLGFGKVCERPKSIEVSDEWSIYHGDNIVPSIKTGTWTPVGKNEGVVINSVYDAKWILIGKHLTFYARFNVTVSGNNRLDIIGLPYNSEWDYVPVNCISYGKLSGATGSGVILSGAIVPIMINEVSNGKYPLYIAGDHVVDKSNIQWMVSGSYEIAV